MVEVGGKPILWHIMNIYACQGVREFVIALGYKGEAIKEYFLNFYAFNNDLTVDMSTGSTTIHDGKQPDWKVHLVDTGIDTMTGGRLKRLAHWLEPDEEFMFTYGDGVADIEFRLASAGSTWKAIGSIGSTRSPPRPRGGSAEASSCSIRRCWTTSKATTRPSRTSPWNASSRRIS
jgi:glucose-1-phosphate cytidylyltransferase